MTCNQIINFIESWAPKGAAWQKDNPGLQAGDPGAQVENIFLCLELTQEAFDEALKRKCNFVFTHHPLIFQPIKKLNLQSDKTSILLSGLIKNNITLYSAHTNLDFTKGGVSYQLAEELGLQNIRFIENLENTLYKLNVFVPAKDADALAEALFAAGSGTIGEYKKCSFRSSGMGTFEGSGSSKPAIGSPGKFEMVDEVKLEFSVESWNLDNAVSALIKNHPYEEPAFDIFPSVSKNSNFGYGAIGELPEEMAQDKFLAYTAEKLNLPGLRYCSGKDGKIRTVAVCGGSGSDLIAKTIQLKADAFVTADIKYHPFQDADKKILLIDAGHYETEVIALKGVKSRLEAFLTENKSDINIYIYGGSTSPVKFLTIKERT
ncbi:MAG TPA: Nif3-like dinuclear metal center hexameric protein [Ignavibacteriales bacterium]|nr:Nif3-like dinuclear metal center hexameric protein [Ignavibacteriales bacterium]